MAGVFLIPLGGVVAVIGIVVSAVLGRSETMTNEDLADFLEFVWGIAFQHGCVAVAPIGIVVLPLAYFILRWRSALIIGAFVFTGVISAILELSMLVFGFRQWEVIIEQVPVFFVVTYASIGVSAGFAFAYLTRLMRPADWRRMPGPMPSEA